MEVTVCKAGGIKVPLENPREEVESEGLQLIKLETLARLL